MAEIQPFRGLRYNTSKVRLEEVITEPYDRITPVMQEDYYRRSPYNIVRIILGKDEEPDHPEKDKYERARLYLKAWEDEGIFIREDRPALYLYEQEFEADGQSKQRLGLIARVRLEDFSSKKVLPHEKTFPKPKEDRLRLLRATMTNTEQIFLLYPDDEKKVGRAIAQALERAEEVGDACDEDGVHHRVLAIKLEKDIQNIRHAMADKVLIIADGHHRYETSLNFKQEMVNQLGQVRGDEPFHFVMMTLFDVNEPGLVILPTYRLVKGLERLNEESFKTQFSETFEIKEIAWPNVEDRAGLAKAREMVNRGRHTFAVYISGLHKLLVLQLKNEDLLTRVGDPKKSLEWKSLDVAILHSLMIDRLGHFSSRPFIQEECVSYIRNLEQGLRQVAAGEWQMIFLLKPCSLSEVRKIVEKGELMPHKSTDFFPKLKSGLILNPLHD
ncbi:MAG: DUF1015 domain-containing protein [Candidatus Aminicenantales bacterium]